MTVTINGSAGVTTNSGAVYDSLQRGTAVASTSGTSIDFTSIPSWVRRITVMFQSVSTSGTSIPQVQLGTGSTSYTTSGYVVTGASFNSNSVTSGSQATSGFILETHNPYFTAAAARSGQLILTNISGNNWVGTSIISGSWVSGPSSAFCAGQVSLGAALTAVRITTVNGTDTFDAGTINIIYE
jgi:hypothetical protein